MYLLNLFLAFFFFMNPAEQISGEQPIFSFGIFADAQYADVASAGNRYYSSSLARLKDAYETFRNEKVDFVINLGDLIDRNLSSFAPVIEIIRESGIKTFHVTGNHDYAVPLEDKDKLPVMAKDDYYSFSLKGFRFIFLDGNEVSLYSAMSESDEKFANDLLTGMRASGMKNATDWNGAMSPEQIKWLDKELSRAELKDERAIIICHFPIFPDDVHNLLNYNEALSVLDEHTHVIAWFAGHNHAGNYGRYKNVHCLTFRGMVETSSSTSFAVIDVLSDRLIVRGSGREENRTLVF